MANASDPDLLVLLALRLRTLAEDDTIAETTGLTGLRVGEALAGLAEAGRVRRRDGRASGWMLTEVGRDDCGAHLAIELDQTATRTTTVGAYSRFLSVNQTLLDLCTRWQLREVDGADVINDHRDAAHDGAVLADLVSVDAVGQSVCAEMAWALDRFGGYGGRLAAARRVEAGDPDWLTSPTVDSYHAVWFELHENLLVTLGIERGHEPSEPSTSLQEAR